MKEQNDRPIPGIETLTDMGFATDVARAALDRTGGDVSNAISFLMGETMSQKACESAEFQELQTLTHQYPALLQSFIEKASPNLQFRVHSNPIEFIKQLNDVPKSTRLMHTEDEEKDDPALLRLFAMGFDPSIARQVYIACDRNEHLAATMLLN